MHIGKSEYVFILHPMLNITAASLSIIIDRQSWPIDRSVYIHNTPIIYLENQHNTPTIYLQNQYIVS